MTLTPDDPHDEHDPFSRYIDKNLDLDDDPDDFMKALVDNMNGEGMTLPDSDDPRWQDGILFIEDELILREKPGSETLRQTISANPPFEELRVRYIPGIRKELLDDTYWLAIAIPKRDIAGFVCEDDENLHLFSPDPEEDIESKHYWREQQKQYLNAFFKDVLKSVWPLGVIGIVMVLLLITDNLPGTYHARQRQHLDATMTVQQSHIQQLEHQVEALGDTPAFATPTPTPGQGEDRP